MKAITKQYLKRKINQLNKKIHRAEEQENENKIWWRKMKLEKLKDKLNKMKLDKDWITNRLKSHCLN